MIMNSSLYYLSRFTGFKSSPSIKTLWTLVRPEPGISDAVSLTDVRPVCGSEHHAEDLPAVQMF